LATILIVDDHQTSHRLMHRILNDHYHVIHAQSGAEAFDLLELYRVDVVVLDIVMAEMDGLSVLDALRQHSCYRNLPVVLVSAMATSQQIALGLARGANDFIPKPYDPVVLKARIDAQVNLKQSLDDRDRTIYELQSLQQTQSRLMRMAHHDIRNPISNVRMARDVLETQLASSPEAMQTVEALMLAVDTMQEVLEDFVHAFGVKDVAYNLQPLAVSGLIARVMMEYQLAAMNKGITINAETLDGTVYADPTRLTQVISNLVSNSIKYSPPGHQVTIWTETDDQTIAIAVQDEGPGIPPAERDKLFTEFGRLSTQPTGNEASIGLGLWIVKQLVEGMGGTVDATFPEYGGSIFWVRLPIA